MKKIPLTEKVKLTSGQGSWHLFESPFLEGRRINVADGPHGVRVYGETIKDKDLFNKRYIKPATLFPAATAMAATWNRALIEKAAETIGKECRFHQVDVLLAPGINLKRSPLGGRNFEYYSEDPYLTSEMGQAFVKGIQSQNIGACIKHFGLNEQETMRRFVDVKVDERTMHEMYLYPFYHVIKKCNPWMVMSSYNKLNGHYASESSYLLQDILRKRWEYTGVVVSDWGAVQNKVKSLKNGMNIEMPGPSAFEKETLEALKNGTLSESTLDESLEPLFELHEKIKPIEKIKEIDLDQHHDIATKVAEEAIVLLENDGILPLKNLAQKVGIIGQFAKEPRINGGGSSTVRPYKQEIPLDAFSNVFQEIAYADGYLEDETSEELIEKAIHVAKESEIVFYFTGTTPAIETEGKDRDHIALPQAHQKVFDAIRKVNANLIVILSNGSALDLRAIQAQSRAVLETWFLGGAAAKAIVEIIKGDINPSGRLQETFPLKLEHTPHFGTFPQLIHVDYRQDLIMNGYRYYDTHQYPVLYPFGYGLSYADIVYQNIAWHLEKRDEAAYVTVDITLKNNSDIAAYETVQIYIGTSIKHLIKPAQELKAFEKVWLPAQKTKTIQITLPLEAFASYSETAQNFIVYNGSYTIKVARHSRDIVATKKIKITDQRNYAPPITLDYPVKFLALFYPEWFAYIEKHYRNLRWHEREEPIWRVIDRYKRHKNVSEQDIETLIKQIKEAINVQS